MITKIKFKMNLHFGIFDPALKIKKDMMEQNHILSSVCVNSLEIFDSCIQIK